MIYKGSTESEDDENDIITAPVTIGGVVYLKDYDTGYVYDRETYEMIPNLSGIDIFVLRDTGDWSMEEPDHADIPTDVYNYLVSHEHLSGADEDKIFHPWFHPDGDAEEAVEKTRAIMLSKGLVFDSEMSEGSTGVWQYCLDWWTGVPPVRIKVPYDCYEYIVGGLAERSQFDEWVDVEGDAVARDELIAEVRQMMADRPLR